MEKLLYVDYVRDEVLNSDDAAWRKLYASLVGIWARFSLPIVSEAETQESPRIDWDKKLEEENAEDSDGHEFAWEKDVTRITDELMAVVLNNAQSAAD